MSGAARAAGRRAFVAALLGSPLATGMARRPYGGSLELKLPFAFRGVDPHVLDDPISALFAPAVFDTVFDLDSRGNAFPALAESMPEKSSKGARIELRPGLSSARGKQLDARDLAYSFVRARERGGTAHLAQIEPPVVDPKRPLSLVFPGAHPDELAKALAVPITALVPRGYNALRPDGTGAFVAHPRAGGLRLERNPNAARGGAFLDRIEIDQARDLSDALRAFEAGEVDLGWLGRGLHRPRPGARTFEARTAGWVTLRTGANAGNWGAPGVAQQLVDALPADRLKHLGVHAKKTGQGTLWGGPKSSILVDGAAAQLVSIAGVVASGLGREGHELDVKLEDATRLRGLKRSGQFTLMLEFVRGLGAGTPTAYALYPAADPALGRKVPKLTTNDPRTVARTLPLGIVGELAVSGAYLPELHGIESWDFGSCWLERKER
jgi:peptide/nickel transport system substrate-binding protein